MADKSFSDMFIKNRGANGSIHTKVVKKRPGVLPEPWATLEKKTDDIRIAMLHYDTDTLVNRPLNRVEEVSPLLTTTTWINIDGIHDIAVMEHIDRHFGLHPLTLEDVLNTTQRPKTESFDDYLFVVMKKKI